MRKGILCTISIFVIAGVMSGCASTANSGSRVLDKDDYQRAVTIYRDRLAKSPDKADLWRGLGVALYQLDSLDAALQAFAESSRLAPTDAPSVFYRGLIAERKGDNDQAREYYRSYLSMNDDPRLQREAKKRLRWLEDNNLKTVVTTAVTNERNINVAEIPGNTAAIVRFDASTLLEQYRPLGRGIAELIYADLANVPNLTLVERLELSTLQSELKLGQSEFSDKFTAPRIGRLVGAAKVVTGQLNSKPDNVIELDAGIIDVGPGLASYPDRQEGKVSDFFKMQKALSFEIISKLGYEITPQIRNVISKPATESMLALIAYSRGLEYVDQGMYSLAEAEFKASLHEDVNFGLAKAAVQEFSGLSDYDGKLRPIAEVAALANTEVITENKPDVNRGTIIERLQESTRGTAPDQEDPYVAPRVSRGTVVVRGRTD